MTEPILAAVRFETGDIDGLLDTVVQTLSSQGYTVRGALQTRGVVDGECHCADMDLHMIGCNKVFRISQPLGNGSRGCRLHHGALAECAAFLENELDHVPDLLVLNRFGRGEAYGRGFRDLIGKAILQGVPVLTAVRPTYEDDWATFGLDMSCNLPMKKSAVLDWFDSVRGLRRAA